MSRKSILKLTFLKTAAFKHQPGGFVTQLTAQRDVTRAAVVFSCIYGRADRGLRGRYARLNPESSGAIFGNWNKLGVACCVTDKPRWASRSCLALKKRPSCASIWTLS